MDGKGSLWVEWKVDTRKLESDSQQIVSPEFIVDMPNARETPFKFVLFPVKRPGREDKRIRGSFRSCRGRVRIELKCCQESPEAAMKVTFSLGIGGSCAQPLLGPVTHDFSERTCHGLKPSEEAWNS